MLVRRDATAEALAAVQTASDARAAYAAISASRRWPTCRSKGRP